MLVSREGLYHWPRIPGRDPRNRAMLRPPFMRSKWRPAGRTAGLSSARADKAVRRSWFKSNSISAWIWFRTNISRQLRTLFSSTVYAMAARKCRKSSAGSVTYATSQSMLSYSVPRAWEAQSVPPTGWNWSILQPPNEFLGNGPSEDGLLFAPDTRFSWNQRMHTHALDGRTLWTVRKEVNLRFGRT